MYNTKQFIVSKWAENVYLSAEIIASMISLTVSAAMRNCIILTLNLSLMYLGDRGHPQPRVCNGHSQSGM